MKNQQTEKIRQFIIDSVADNKSNISSLVAEKYEISRQAVNRHLQNMVKEGILTATGTTRNKEYSLKTLVTKIFEFKMTDDVLRNKVTNSFDENSTELEEYGFTKTTVPVALARYGDENLISRSQAKRLLACFDQFKHVILDFTEVDSIGPAFADEIFRVFALQHPDVKLSSTNTNDDIEKMIRRATASAKS